MPVTMGGISSGMDTDGLIEKLVNVEARPIRQLEIRKKNHSDRKEALKKLEKQLADMNNAARDLYGFRAIFDDKTAVSSDTSVIEAKAASTAEQATRSIEVTQLATMHRVASDPVKEDETLPAGAFTIEVAGEKAKVSFGGGRLKNLQEKIEAAASSLVSSSYGRTSGDSYILTLESKKSGERGEIKITGDRDLLLKIGLIGEGSERRSIDVSVTFDEEYFSPYRGSRETGPDTGKVSVRAAGKTVAVKGSTWREYELPVPVEVKEGTRLEFDFSLAVTTGDDDSAPTRIKVGPKEKTNIKGIILESYNVERKRSEERGEDGRGGEIVGIGLVSTAGGTRVEKLFPLAKEARGRQTLDLGKDFAGRKVDRIVMYCGRGLAEFAAVKFSTPIQAKDFAFKNTIAQPLDAKLKVDGIEITRDRNNDLSDVIKGLTLNIKRTSPHAVTLTITGNVEASIEKVKRFVDAYNRYLDIHRELTKAVISAKPGEFDKVQDESGLFMGDMTLTRLENLIRTTVNSAYPNRAERPIRMLPEMGITTGAVNAAWESIKSGKLTVDEVLLKKTITENSEGVVQFFGSDTDGDGRPDDGMAVKLVSALRPYISPGKNILAAKLEQEDNSIKLVDESIKRREEHLKKYEEKLRGKFSRMERAMSESNAQRQWMRYQFEGISGVDSDNKKK